MAQFQNMFNVDLDNRSYPVALNQTVSEGNVNSNRIGAYVYRNGAEYSLGGSCTGMAMRADGTTVPLTGVIDGNAAYVVLDQPSCAIPGPIQVAVNWVSGSNTTTLIVAYGTVILTDTRAYVQPGTPIPDINTLLAELEQWDAAATKAVRYDTNQGLTSTQKTTARGNIDAPSNADLNEVKNSMAVRYDTTQSLTSAQKTTARGNIEAKHVQSAVSNPTASGTSTAFVDSISQNENGVITPTRKSIPTASQSAAGLMTAADKTKLDGIATGAQVNSITGVKGNAESSYRTGNVNLTPANIGAQPAGDYVQYASQSLTDAQKRQARANIDTPSNADLTALTGTVISIREDMAVRYDTAQSLTDSQKTQARTNIWAPSNSDLNDVLDKLNKRSILGNAVTPIRWTIAYDSSQHTITLSGAMFYPKTNLNWTGAINATIDFSSSSHPNNLKVLLIDTDAKQAKIYSVEDDDGDTLNNKTKWHPVCAVDSTGYLWTASAIPSTYYINGIDIYDNSVRYDTTQNLTDAQKATARNNIDVPSFAQAVTSSSLTFVRETAESQADDGVYRDLDTVPKNTIVTYYISGTASIDHIPELSYGGFQATVITFAQNGTNSSDIGVVQMCVDAVTNNIYMRINWSVRSTWSPWFTPYNTDIADQIGYMQKYSTDTNTIVLKKTGSVIRQGAPIYIRGDFISEDVHVDSTFAYMTLYGVYGPQESGGYDVFGQYLGFSGDVMEITPLNDYHHINVYLNNFNRYPSGVTWGISANIDQTDGASILSTIEHAPWDNGLLKPYNTDVELNKLFGLSGNSGDVLTVRYTSKENIASNSVTVFGMYGPIQSDGFDNLGTVDYGAVRQFTLQRDYAGFQIYAPGVGAGASYCVSAAVNLINGVQKDVLRIDQHSARSFNSRTCNIFHKVVCVGDSYTSGHIQTPSESAATGTNENYAWPRFMEQLTGGNTYVNCGISGATTVTWQTGARGLAKAQASGRAQAYIIGLMINDSAASSAKYVPVGVATDIGTDNNTYYAQMSKIVRELNAISPQAKIFINTCPKSDAARYAPYNQAVRDIVEYYADTYPVHCIDLVEYADLYAMQSLVDDFTNDHYTALGYEQFAEIYAYILSDYINTHVSAFQDVYKIPYDMPE